VSLGAGALWTPAAPADPVAGSELRITSPADGSFTKAAKPVFSGTIYAPVGLLEEVGTTVRVSVFRDEHEVAHAETESVGRSWSAEATEALKPGTYTAIATQPGAESKPPVRFTVDVTAPAPAITRPAPGSVLSGTSVVVGGTAGTAAGDIPAVQVDVFAGATSAAPLESLKLPVSAGAWSGALGGLTPGSYVLRVQQSDAAGNTGIGPLIAFTVPAVAPPVPPIAAFQWFPSSPRVGEAVSFVSGSTDLASPITSFAWAVGPTAPLQAGGSVFTQKFAKPGLYTVRLRVIDAAGRSGLVTHTIRIRARSLITMQPFPIVRIAGTETSTGVRLSLLSVLAPTSSTVTVRVRGAGIRTVFQSRVARVGKHRSAAQLLTFPRFQTALRAGSVLEILVTKAGQIGKYTRFAPRRGQLPVRTDSCASPAGKPMRCPA
jgi:PKD repeat protein